MYLKESDESHHRNFCISETEEWSMSVLLHLPELSCDDELIIPSSTFWRPFISSFFFQSVKLFKNTFIKTILKVKGGKLSSKV